jgi:hypothetical protein
VEEQDSTMTLQIVEKSQIALSLPENRAVLEAATHFNPVDLVCGLRDHKGKKFDLEKFVDKNAVFISQKPYNNTQIKALELPGLWNGAMAYWNTVFIEVPLATFTPVKTVNDLLRDMHQ